MLKYKPDFEHAQRYWDAFWDGDIIDRPCTAVWAQKSQSTVSAPGTQPVDITDFSALWNRMDEYLETHVFLGEAIPGFRPGFGPDQFAGFLGSPLKMSSGGDTSWSEKIVTDWNSFLPLKIDEQNACWHNMTEFHNAAERYTEGKCLLYNIDMHSNIDALEGLRGAQNLLFDIIDRPQTIAEAMRQVQPLYDKVADHFYHYGNKKRNGTAAQLFMYSRGRYDAVQADFISLLSPEMFRQFVLPAIEREAACLDHCCFHLDGEDALKHLDDILTVQDIDAVQWVPGAGKKPQSEWSDVLHKIQAAGKRIVLYGTPEKIRHIHGEYRPELLVYDVRTETPEEGQELLDWLTKHS